MGKQLRTIDQIRKYINDGIANQKLQPGSSLPSCYEFTKLCSGSYATVRSALSKLQAEGLVQVENGVGSFLAGGKPLTIRLNVIDKSLSLDHTRELLEKYLAGKNLNLQLEIGPTSDLVHRENYNRILENYNAVITMFGDERIFHLPQAQLDHFPDYSEVVAQLRIDNEQLSRVAIPFCQTYFFMVANGKLQSESCGGVLLCASAVPAGSSPPEGKARNMRIVAGNCRFCCLSD